MKVKTTKHATWETTHTRVLGLEQRFIKAEKNDNKLTLCAMVDSAKDYKVFFQELEQLLKIVENEITLNTLTTKSSN